MSQRAPGGVHTLRRVIVLLLLAILVSVAASGAGGLLHLALDLGAVLQDTGHQLAQSIASVIIAAPLGALVYWLIRRWLASFHDRHSLLWPVYLAAFGTVALLIALSSLLTAFDSGIAGDWRPDALATGLVWGFVWAWHLWMWRTATHAPTRLVDVGPALGVLVGAGFTVAGSIGALSRLFEVALDAGGTVIAGTSAWWLPALQSLVWALGGALVWWWHWVRCGIRSSHTGFAAFTLVVIAGFAAVAATLGGLASAAYSLLALGFGIGGGGWDATDSSTRLVEQLATGAAAAAVGALLWTMHRAPVAAATPPVRWSARLVASGVALAYTASGLGVVVNAALAATVDSLAGDERSLLFGGLSALVVGAVAWWVLWRPAARAVEPPEAAGESAESTSWATFSGRRVYLVTVFGVSALAAVITLLVIAYGVLQAVIGVPWGGSIIESIRAPLGLLTATALVAVYHFVVWRRMPQPAATDAAAPRVERVTLVLPGEPGTLAGAVRALTGASVTVWPTREPGTPPSAEEVVAALSEVRGGHVLVVALGARLDVVPLGDEEWRG